MGDAVAEDELVAALVERAAGAVADVFADELEGGGAIGSGDGGGDVAEVRRWACGAEWLFS